MNLCSIEKCGKKVNSRKMCSMHYARWRKYGDPLAVAHIPKGAAWLFLQNAMEINTDECIPWPFYANSKGYGRIHRGASSHLVSRVICAATHGEPPTKKHQAAHDCGFSGCVNRRHIKWKTATENDADKDRHGTRPHGETSSKTKLSANLAVTIFQRVWGGEKQEALAAEYGVTAVAISDIKCGKTWARYTMGLDRNRTHGSSHALAQTQ